ncbi:Hif prolyl hydroxylase [Favolaschia claudopus]|uniref:Hif prolyl hydroxylase n=1 Tax=Favolaschia claudopus TaxID=2862362 RepID=A0AAW0ALS1_9AGAR
MTSTVLSRHCAVCDRETSLWCSRCQAVWYCSQEHNTQAWPEHRLQCRSVATVPNSDTIATSTHIRWQRSVQAIFLPMNEDHPRMITVNLRPSGGACPVPMLEPYCKGSPNSIVLQRALNEDLLRFPLHLFYDSERHVNRAVQRITTGLAEKPFLGNVVVLKYNGTRRADYMDPTTHDLPTLSAYFLYCQ